MKKAFWILAAAFVLIGCSHQTEYVNDLTGRWFIYKITRDNIDQTHLVGDSFQNYSITFTADGKYLEMNPQGADSNIHTGTWAFQNSYGQLVMTDTGNVATTYTIFNLTGNHVELLKDKEDRYLRKFQ